MQRGSFSPERLRLIRRLRKARRLFKQLPLFAYQLMSQEDPNYTYGEFIEDLRIRTKPRPKRRKDQSVTFGRYSRIRKLLADFRESGDIRMLIDAEKLQKRLRKPYLVRTELKGHCFEFSFSAKVDIARIEEFTVKLSRCRSAEEIQSCYEKFCSTIHLF